MHLNSDYKPEYCRLIIDIFKGGGSVSDFCVRVGVSRRCLYKWIDRYPSTFGECYRLAREYGKQYRDNKAMDGMWQDNSEGAVNFDVRSYLKLTARRFSDLDKESPPPKILDKKKDADLVKATRRLIEAAGDESLTIDQSKVIGNILKTLLEVKEKEEIEQRINQLEQSLKEQDGESEAEG